MKKKQEIITFKVDEDLGKAIKGLPNRSEFIRSVLVSALGNVCPLCNGSGLLTVNQKRHWDDFCADHTVTTCGGCHESIIVCSHE